MVDMSQFVAPRSTQLNADDLISGPINITVTKVAASGNAEQPVMVSYDGDNGRPYLPCKSMRRVMIHVWGKDAADYVGRSMTLYCDPEVMFGGMKMGGIRISNMSHIDKPTTIALTATKASRKPFTVKPLVMTPAKAAPNKAETGTAGLIERIQACQDAAALQAMSGDPALVEWRGKLAKARPDLDEQITAAFTARMEALSDDGSPHPGDVHLAGVEQDVGDMFGGASA